ncbi:winged helix-turn-helix domain-containing protein [Streptomyces sp. CB02366]|uniref:winged helix-turn-helix domain-containing protein n=1 Tax=Streptomyces sp. CB02366 TaxID=1703935 RepID=UPI003FD0AA97
MTEPGVGKYLRRWGLSFQQPDKRAVEQNRRRCGPGWRRHGRRSGRRRRPRTVRCCSPTRSESVLIRAPVAPGTRRAAPRSYAAPAIGSP